jgi:hypothetical protein
VPVPSPTHASTSDPRPDDLASLSAALGDASLAAAATQVLAARSDDASTALLCGALSAPASLEAGMAVARELGRHPGSSTARAALRAAIGGRLGPLRLEALRRLPVPGSSEPPAGSDDAASLALLTRCLSLDPSPPVRREALRLLSLVPGGEALLLPALTDPVWRVRRDLLGKLVASGTTPARRGAIRAAILALAPLERPAEGVLHALEDAWGLPRSPVAASSAPAAPGSRRALDQASLPALPFWDPDPVVMLARMEHLGPEQLRPHLAALPALIALQEGKPQNDAMESLRSLAVRALVAEAGAAEGALMLSLLGEPRLPFALAWVEKFLEELPAPRADALARLLLDDERAHPRAALVWARSRAASAVPRQQARQSLPAAAPPGGAAAPATSPYFRTSTASPRPANRPLPGQARVAPPAACALARPLGEGGPLVAPLGLSGRHGLPARGYHEALDSGVNMLFWEPEYDAMTGFVAALSPAVRRKLVLVCGTFEATAAAIRRDAERALRMLGVEQLPAFFLFWARSEARLGDEALSALARLRDEGKVALQGVSSHDRPLLSRALRLGLPLVMLRHSAAHTGAESVVLPEAAALGAGVITFTNLCYGQLLLPRPALGLGPPPLAPALYRYSLSQPGVSACVSAPRSLGELRDNLSVLGAPLLPEPEQERLRQFGRAVYVDGRAFLELLRSR